MELRRDDSLLYPIWTDAGVEGELRAIQNADMPCEILYKEPTDLASFRQLLIDNAAFAPKLKSFLSRRFKARFDVLKRLAAKQKEESEAWNLKVKKQEEHAADRSELDHQPSTHHISTLLTKPSPSSSTAGPGTMARPSNRRADVVRSEEEMNRVIQSLIEQERDNPETRWLATAATVNVQLAASSKCLFNDVYIDLNRQITDTCPYLVPETVWSEQEERLFVDRYLQFPKDFRKIAAGFPFKTTSQCVRFYYKNKHRLQLKSLLLQTASSVSGSSASSRKRSQVDDYPSGGKKVK